MNIELLPGVRWCPRGHGQIGGSRALCAVCGLPLVRLGTGRFGEPTLAWSEFEPTPRRRWFRCRHPPGPAEREHLPE